MGNRRDKVAKASKALWKLMDGDEDSDDEHDSVGLGVDVHDVHVDGSSINWSMGVIVLSFNTRGSRTR